MPERQELEKKIHYTFNDARLLEEALTHRSYLNEHPSWRVPHNERLEFLGDAVLEIIVSEFLFRTFPEQAEGELTSYRAALVNYVFLSKVAGSLKLDTFLYLSKGEAKDSEKARDVILANALEALIGAMYLDGGLNAAKSFIEQFITVHIREIIDQELFRDAKSHLQEIAQEKLKLTPTYALLDEWGPDHKKQFRMGAYFGDKLIAEGEGPSKQEAELEAARKALDALETA